MTEAHSSADTPETIAATLLRLSPGYAATPLLDLPRLAAHLGVAQILAKDEGRRMLGSFKSLGGTYAGLGALARHIGTDIPGLLAGKWDGTLPTLICASDGNHGLAVAAAARFAGGSARIFLHGGVPASRAARIAAQGAAIIWTQGTYDDAVDAAAEAARAGQGLLIADTTDEPGDPIVADVMAGYGVMASEIIRQVAETGGLRPTHIFVQAGVGGLAAAMAEGLRAWMAAPALVVVTEPEAAACVSAALSAGRIFRLTGALETSAEMLACGEASAPAMAVLARHAARVVTLSEAALDEAPLLLRAQGGPATTASGAAGLAGLVAVMGDEERAAALGLGRDSRVLILVTEGVLDGEAAGN